MSKRKNPKDPKDSGEPKHPQKPNEPYPDRERPKHKPEGREHEVHKEILARRMRGGPEPTPEAYARALEQWQQLPGSVVRPPTDVTPSTPEPADPPDVSLPESAPNTNDAGDEDDQP
jgi:hypothetical protein